jgi:hypothetical protein
VDYRQALRDLKDEDWDAYLMQMSGLPGPRGNLELADIVAAEASPEKFEHFLTFDSQRAPVNSPEEFLAFCGILGLGVMAVASGPGSEGYANLVRRLRTCASDPRWRSREAVAMALQRIGRADILRLVADMEDWASGSRLEQRAAAAALAEPGLLQQVGVVRAALNILDKITQSMVAAADHKDPHYKTLRQGMAYCWSVVAAALPAAGLPYLEHWLVCSDPDVRWLMRENLKKKRLEKAAPEWVARWK